MKNKIIKAVLKLIQQDKNVVILTADNGFMSFEPLREMMPDKFFNFGIAEASMVTFAAGMESCGKVPYVITMATFLMHRAFEQIRNDICVQSRNIKLIGIGCGLHYSLLGSSHHAVDDITAAVSLPNMNVLCPCGLTEAGRALVYAHKIKGPVYIRFNNSSSWDDNECLFKDGNSVLIKKSKDLMLVCTGDMLAEVVQAQSYLEEQGFDVGIFYMPTLKPFDDLGVVNMARSTKRVLTVEEHLLQFGFGSLVRQALSKYAIHSVMLKNMGLDDLFPKTYGTHEKLLEQYGLSSRHIAKAAIEMLKSEQYKVMTYEIS